MRQVLAVTISNALAKAVLVGWLSLLPLSACISSDSRSTMQQQVLQSAGVLQPARQEALTLPVGDARSVIITIYSDQPDCLANVLDPSGDVRQTAATSDRPLKDVLSFEGAYTARMILKAPKDGVWRIELSAEVETWYALVVDTESSTMLDVRTDRQRYPTSAPIRVTAKLFRGSALVGGGTMRAEMRQASNSAQFLDLQETESGVFEGLLYAASESMKPDLVVTAVNGTVQRQVSVPLVIFESNARIREVLSEQLQDTDNDGKADHLILNVQLDVAQASRYILAAHLADEKGDTIAYAQLNTAIRAALGKGSDRIDPGQPVISLSFSGQEINRTGIDGPYFVRMILYDIDQGGAQIDALESDYVTRPYPARNFE